MFTINPGRLENKKTKAELSTHLMPVSSEQVFLCNRPGDNSAFLFLGGNMLKTWQEEEERRAHLKAFYVMGAILLFGIIILALIFVPQAHAENCQDPDKLPENLKIAYYQLKKAEKDIPGMTVSIRRIETVKKEGGK